MRESSTEDWQFCLYQGLQRDVVYLGSWPTNSALVYEPKCGGGGGGELRGLSDEYTAVLYTGAQINFGDITSVQILGAEAWEDMHSSPTTKKLFDAFNTSFTRGGVNIIRYFYPILERMDASHSHRLSSVVTAWTLFLCRLIL